MLKNARHLRHDLTEAEKVLWHQLRNRQVRGFKFKRQHIIGKYIVDFICINRDLIIEIDGFQHMDNEDYDYARTKYLESCGYKVIRFWNNDVLNNINSVLTAILDELENEN